MEGPGLISGETRPPDRLRPCRSAPVGAFRPPPAPTGASYILQDHARRPRRQRAPPPRNRRASPAHKRRPSPKRPVAPPNASPRQRARRPRHAPQHVNGAIGPPDPHPLAPPAHETATLWSIGTFSGARPAGGRKTAWARFGGRGGRTGASPREPLCTCDVSMVPSDCQTPCPLVPSARETGTRWIHRHVRRARTAIDTLGPVWGADAVRRAQRPGRHHVSRQSTATCQWCQRGRQAPCPLAPPACETATLWFHRHVRGRGAAVGGRRRGRGWAGRKELGAGEGGATGGGIWVGVRVLYVYGQEVAARLCLADRYNSIGAERFRLRWLNQGKRAEGCGCDLVNPVTAKQ